MSLLAVENISVNFGQKKVLKEVNLTVDRGEIVTLIGPNGAGKSTLVRIIVGLLKPTHGSIHWQGKVRIGYMPQKLVIEPYLPLNVLRFLQLAGGVTPQYSEIRTLLKEVHALHVQNHPVQEISGGELQRVLLARALLQNPDLLVLDEPVQGVDVMGQADLYQLIMRIRDRRNCGVLMVSHDLHVVMAGTDSVICLNHHVCCSGRPEAVGRHPEFLSLFGLKEPLGIAVYAHDHDHRHDHHAHGDDHFGDEFV